MRLPWIQLDKAGIAKCRVLAQLLKIPAPHAIGIGTMLWEWALELAPDGDFSGTIPDADLLAAAVEWPVEDATRLVTQLQRVGMIATIPQLRVRGLDRYKAAWEKNQRRNGKSLDSGGSVPATGENRPVSPGNREKPGGTARKTETETETDKKQKTFAGLAGASPPEAKSTKAPKEDKPTDPRHAPLRRALCQAFEGLRGVPYPFGPRDAGEVSRLLATNTPPEAIAAAWSHALRSSGFPKVATLAELNTHLAHFVGTGPPSRGGIQTEVMRSSAEASTQVTTGF